MGDRSGRKWGPARPLLGTAVGAAILWGLLLGAGIAAASEGAEKGRALAERLCARCHMAPGQGEKRGVNDIPGFGAVAQRRGQTTEGIVLWLRSIPPMMPNHHLSQDEMFALAEFIMTLRDAPTDKSKR
jgi:cytochrome c553